MLMLSIIVFVIVQLSDRSVFLLWFGLVALRCVCPINHYNVKTDMGRKKKRFASFFNKSRSFQVFKKKQRY